MYFADLIFNIFLITKSLHKKPEIKVSKDELKKIGELPVYTIFCPLYKEWEVIEQFVSAISNIDYDKNKLQFLLLLEQDDEKTIEYAKNLKLPKYIEIIVVPHSMPKTKPKACNYGLHLAKGEYCVIYDAEDIPDPKQLKKAICAFKKSDESVVCIQAKLNFYNPFQNLLSRIFTAEYSLWFDLILPGLQTLNAPIPLGGTSNHFKTEFLKSTQGWDAFNVTEDCDLGMRLFKRGHLTALLDSTTYEEANTQLKNWYGQRTRWVKGYIQSYLVHSRFLTHTMRDNTKHHILTFLIIVGGKTLSMFINPFMWLLTLLYFAYRTEYGTVFPTYSFVYGSILFNCW